MDKKGHSGVRRSRSFYRRPWRHLHSDLTGLHFKSCEEIQKYVVAIRLKSVHFAQPLQWVVWTVNDIMIACVTVTESYKQTGRSLPVR